MKNKKTIEMMDKYGNCPECGSSWDGGDIPTKHRELYSEPYKWSRLIAITDIRTDCTEFYRCPDCEATWDRWTGKLLIDRQANY